MSISEKRAMELMDDLHYGRFDEHQAFDCFLCAVNNKKTEEQCMWVVRNMQKHMERGNYSDVKEISNLVRLGEIAAKGYVEQLYMREKWYEVMDVPTRCACGKQIAKFLWEH